MSTLLTNRVISLAAMIAVLAVLATACAPTPPLPPTPAPAAVPTAAPTQPPATTGVKVLRLGRGTYPDVLDPQKSSFVSEIGVLKLTYEGLLSIDEKGNVGPGGADKWTYSTDGTKMTFHIRDGLVRSDGIPITAQDYEYALKREVDPCVPGKMYTSIVYDVRGAADLDALDCKKDAAKLDAAWSNYGVKALDHSNLEVTFNSPVGFWPYVASTWVTYPTDMRQVDKDPDIWWTKPGGHIGNGPFKIQTIEQGKRIVFVPNGKYWRGKPKLDRIEMIYNTDQSSTFQAFKKGEVDMYTQIAADNLGSINADPVLKTQLVRVPAATTAGIVFNLTKKPFDDINVRKAFSAGFDREGYVRDVLKGVGKAYTRWIPPGVPGAQDDKPGVPAYDPKAAVNYLVSNGYAAQDSTADKPKVDCDKLGPIKLTYGGTPLNTARFQWVAGNYVAVFGCPITLDPVDPTVWISLGKDIKTRPPISTTGWVQDYPHPQNWLSVYWVCDGFAKRFGYCNKTFDALTAKADQTLDLQQALVLYGQAEDIVMQDVPFAFTNYDENLHMVAPWVIGPKDHTGSSDGGWAGEWGPVWTYDIDLTHVPANYPKE